MIQEIVVANKSQFLSAIECAKHCPYDTHIKIIGISTEFIIRGTEVIPEPDKKMFPVPIGKSKYPKYLFDAWDKYAKKRKFAGRNVNKLKSKARKLEASLFRG